MTALSAISESQATLSIYSQLGSMAIAFLVGRFVLRSRSLIMLISFLGAAGAMLANILVDGQGAFLAIGFAPFIYFAAVVGRRDLHLGVRRIVHISKGICRNCGYDLRGTPEDQSRYPLNYEARSRAD